MNKCLRILFLILGISLSQYSWSGTELPVKSFASLPNVSGLRLSPDGMHIATLLRLDSGANKGTAIHIRNIDKEENFLLLSTDNKKYVLNWLHWANNTELLISARFPEVRFGNPTTETRLMVVNIHTRKTRVIPPKRFTEKQGWQPQFQDNIIDDLHEDPRHILLSYTAKDVKSSQVLKANVSKNSNPKKIQSSIKYVYDWITDRQHRVRIGLFFNDTTNKVLTKDLGQDDWRTLWEYETFSDAEVSPLGFAQDPNLLYYSAYHEGLLAIFKVDVTDANLSGELVFANPNYDVQGRLIYSKKNSKVVGISHGNGGGYTYFDEDYLWMQKSLDKALPETDNKIIDMDDEESRIIVKATSQVDAGTYYLWDRKLRTMEPLARLYPSLTPDIMFSKEKISYTARDGLEIEGYLTQAVEKEGDPQPTIIFPHGGPISYDGKGFDYWTQFFANRGYTVLQMNFRGSSGYGHDFMKSGLKNWGLEMQNDVEDGTRWLIDEKIADPDKICIVGASYGGYAALMEAANNSDLYQCAVSFAGVTDLPYLVKSHRRYLNYDVVKEQVGSDFKSLRQRSPVNHAEKINIPILLVHGSKDRSVKPKHGRRMRDKLKKFGKNFKYIEQKNGSHYLFNEQHRMQLFEEMDAFLKKYLTKTS